MADEDSGVEAQVEPDAGNPENDLCISEECENDTAFVMVPPRDDNHESSAIERKIITDFLATKCCIEHCTKSFTEKRLIKLRREAAAIDYRDDGINVLDTVLLGVIRTIYNFHDPVKHARSRKPGILRERGTVRFSIHGRPVCRKVFLFSYNVSVKRFQRLLQVYREDGLVEKRHGNASKKPKTSTRVKSHPFSNFDANIIVEDCN